MNKDNLTLQFFDQVATKVLFSKGADYFFDLLTNFITKSVSSKNIILSVPTAQMSTFHARYIKGEKTLLSSIEGRLSDYSFVQQIKALRSEYYEEPSGNVIYFWLTYYREQDYFLAINSSSDIRSDLCFLEQYFSIYFSNLVSWDRQIQMSELVHIDDVSGLFNQRKMHVDLDYLITESTARKESFAVLFLDIDHFKNVNDKHGHLIGTALLMQVASRLRGVVRERDLLYRYGGDEFVVFLPQIDESMAFKVAIRILDSIRKVPYKIEDLDLISLNISVGVAVFPTDAESKVEILELADKVMYQAKNQGRGQVCMAKDFFSKEKICSDRKIKD